jgi:hypothetical protein
MSGYMELPTDREQGPEAEEVAPGGDENEEQGAAVLSKRGPGLPAGRQVVGDEGVRRARWRT